MTILAALSGLILIQTASAERLPLPVDLPEAPGVAADAACGGREALAAIATCLVTTQAAVSGAVDTLSADFERQGWLAADGEANRIVYVKRRAEGGCDGFQLLAFAGNDNVVAPAAPAYVALAAIPGDVCAAAPATPQ